MSRSRPFVQVDVFSAEPYRGNPVAVILDGADLTDEEMQRVARWTNLSETTFLLPPTTPAADYRVRILTPDGELPFAGHPTLGSAHAWLEAGGTRSRADGLVIQECRAGLIRIRASDGRYAFATPPTIRSGELDASDVDRFVRALGVPRDSVLAHQWVDNGPGWAVLRLPSADAVLALEPDLALIPDAMVGVIGDHPEGSPFAYEMRSFAPGVGVAEDPICGSMNGSVAQWLARTGERTGEYLVSQGARVGRAGAVSISIDGDDVWVGGPATSLFRGHAII